MAAHMALLFFAKVDRENLLYPCGTIQWWLGGQLKNGGQEAKEGFEGM